MGSLTNSFAAWRFEAKAVLIKLTRWLDNHLVLWHYFFLLYWKRWSTKKCLFIVLALKQIVWQARRRKWVAGKPEDTTNSDTFIRAALWEQWQALLLISVARGACVKDGSSVTLSIWFLAWSCWHNLALNSPLPCTYSARCLRSLCLLLTACTYTSLHRQ